MSNDPLCCPQPRTRCGRKAWPRPLASPRPPNPELCSNAPRATTEEFELEVTETTSKPKWPSDDQLQVRAVFDALKRAEGLSASDAIAAAFDGRNSAARKTRVAKVLETLVITGAACTSEDGSKYFVAR
jgi:hypothetical protein